MNVGMKIMAGQLDKKKIKNSGMSLISLVIMIIIMIILSSTVIFSVVAVTNNSKMVTYANDLNTVEQEVEAYYLENNVLPKVEVPEPVDGYTKADLIALTGTTNAAMLESEIDLNLDTLDKFYEVDLTKTKITNSTRGLRKNGDSDIYVVNERNLRVYYVKGNKIGGDTYFSLTEALIKSSKVERALATSDNIALTVETDGIKIIKSKRGFTKSLGMSVSSSLETGDKLRYIIAGTNAIDIVGNSYDLTIDITTMTAIPNAVTYFTRATDPIKTFVVEKVNASNIVIAKATMKIENLDIVIPTIGASSTTKSFSDFNTVTLSEIADLGGSGIKEIRYEYSTKWNSSSQVVDYFTQPITIDSGYLLASGKKIKGNILKLDKNIKSFKMIVLDNAGNISELSTLTIADGILLPEVDVVYKDGYVQTGVNGPSLIYEQGKLITIPVVYAGSGNWKIASIKTKWYEYSGTTIPFGTDNISSKWANVVLVNSQVPAIKDKYYETNNNIKEGTIIDSADIMGMYVWIPRYAYKIRSGMHTATSSPIDVKFMIGTGNAGATLLDADPTLITYTGSSQNQYYVHPAFRFGGVEKTGFWMSKFELSGSTDIGSLKVSAGSISLRSNKIKTFFQSIRNMEKSSAYGWVALTGKLGDNTGLITGDTNNFDTHMIKNSEWGAVAYLTQSRYGRNGVESSINSDSAYTTGGSSTLTTIYSTNVNQSTTGNVYGVYDMNGGSREYTMTYIGQNSSAPTSTVGYNSGTMSTQLDSRYYEGYTLDSLNTLNYLKGSAVYETSNVTGWNSDSATFVLNSTPWFTRGGAYNDTTSAGLFNYVGYPGGIEDSVTTRTIIVVN